MGVVEQRFGQSGTHWSRVGAQALLDRCAGESVTFREEVKPGGGWGVGLGTFQTERDSW